MRKAFVLIVIFFIAFNLQAQWNPLALNYRNVKHPDFFIPTAMHFSDSSNGFILNDATLLQYKDQLWQITKKNDSDLFTYTNLFTLNQANTFLCSYDGKIAKFNGDSLTVLHQLSQGEDDPMPTLNAIFMTDSTEGWAAGDNGLVIKIEHDTIERDSIAVSYNFKDIYFDHHGHGWMIGYENTDFGTTGLICEYKDHHWTLNTYLDEMLYDIEFSSEDSGFISGQLGLYRYNKELNEWQPENIPDYYRQLHISLLNDHYGFSVSDNSSSLIYENGVWSEGPVAAVTDLFSIQTIAPGKAWAISQIGNNNPQNFNEGKIQLLEDYSWSAYPSAVLDSVTTVPVDYAIMSIAGVGKKDLWLNGQHLRIPENQHWFDTIPMLASDSFVTVGKMFSDSFGLGINGDLMQWDGQFWNNKNINTLNPDTTYTNLGMHVFDDTTAFICRQFLVWNTGEFRSTISKYDYNSNSFLSSADLDTRSTFGIHFSDTRNGWCVGDSGLLVKYIDSTWNIQSNITENRLNAVFTNDSLNAWAVGNAGTLLKYAGNSWTQLPLSTEQNLFSIYFTDSTHGWIAGDSGLIFKYNGIEWQRDTSIVTTNKLNAIYMADSTYGFVVGDNGTLFQYIQKKDTIIEPPVPQVKKICESGSTYFNYHPEGTNYSYQWQIDTGNGFENLTDDAIYSGVLSDTLKIAILSADFYGYKFRCIATYEGVDSVGNVEELVYKNKWTGKIDSAWENPANWSCDMIPGPGTDVIIDEGTVVISSAVAIRSLTAAPASNITVAEGGGLEILK